MTPVSCIMSIYLWCLLYHVSCIIYPVSCIPYHVSCLMSPVSRLLSPVSCLTSPVSSLLSLVSHLLSHTSCPTSLLSHVSCLTSSVSRHLSPVSRLLSHVLRFMYYLLCLFYTLVAQLVDMLEVMREVMGSIPGWCLFFRNYRLKGYYKWQKRPKLITITRVKNSVIYHKVRATLRH